jgi:hypothetical protein
VLLLLCLCLVPQGYGYIPPPPSERQAIWTDQVWGACGNVPVSRKMFCNRSLNMKQIKVWKWLGPAGERGRGGAAEVLHTWERTGGRGGGGVSGAQLPAHVTQPPSGCDSAWHAPVQFCSF